MKTLTSKSKKTLQGIKNKSTDTIICEKAKFRLPRLSSIAILLEELDIEIFFFGEITTTTTTGSGKVAISQGLKSGTRLDVREKGFEMSIDTTRTGWKHRTGTITETAKDLIKIIESKIN